MVQTDIWSVNMSDMITLVKPGAVFKHKEGWNKLSPSAWKSNQKSVNWTASFWTLLEWIIQMPSKSTLLQCCIFQYLKLSISPVLNVWSTSSWLAYKDCHPSIDLYPSSVITFIIEQKIWKNSLIISCFRLHYITHYW